MGGVKIKDPSTTFIGYGVNFDTANPGGIIVEECVVITSRATILSHYVDTGIGGFEFRNGIVHIHKFAFIGAGAIICNAVDIGEGAIVGAGSVVTKDIPPYEIWAGNPAKFIKKRIR